MFGANFIKGDVISEPEGQNCFHYNVFGINDEDGGDGQRCTMRMLIASNEWNGYI